MTIGLVRHFKVVDDTKGLWMTSQQFDRWVEHYEQCDIAIHDNIKRAQSGIAVIQVTNNVQ